MEIRLSAGNIINEAVQLDPDFGDRVFDILIAEEHGQTAAVPDDDGPEGKSMEHAIEIDDSGDEELDDDEDEIIIASDDEDVEETGSVEDNLLEEQVDDDEDDAPAVEEEDGEEDQPVISGEN